MAKCAEADNVINEIFNYSSTQNVMKEKELFIILGVYVFQMKPNYRVSFKRRLKL